MKREDDEKLWDLLGHAAEPKISPFFARNVLRKIRESRGGSRLTGWLKWLVPATGVAVAVIAALFLRVQMPDRTHSKTPTDPLALTEAQESEAMADLDDLIASDDSNSLDDALLL
ncbi:MAG: hypothetical protein QOD12_3046 [Verrucomicrobiota bacterium]|jgi:hypothetical protein